MVFQEFSMEDHAYGMRVKYYKTKLEWLYNSWELDEDYGWNYEYNEDDYEEMDGTLNYVVQYSVDPDNYTVVQGQDLDCPAISQPETIYYSGNATWYDTGLYWGETLDDSCRATVDVDGSWPDWLCVSEATVYECWPFTECQTDYGTSPALSATSKHYDWRYEETGDIYYYGRGGHHWFDLYYEYTTEELISRLSADLSSASYSDWTPGYPTASFELSGSEKCASVSKFQANIFVDAPDGLAMTISYTLRTNRNGAITYGYFSGSATQIGGGQYMLEVPDAVPDSPGVTIDLVDPFPSFNLTVAKSQSIIYAKTTAPVSCDDSLLANGTTVTLTTGVPSECVELVIDSVQPGTANIPAFTPPDSGILQFSGNGTWTYTAWTEPQGEKYARSMRVTVKPVNTRTGEQAGQSVSFTVKSAYEHIKDHQAWSCAYEFVRWRYGALLTATGGEFNGVSFDTSDTVSCGFPAVPADACTSAFDNVTFAAGAFNDTENYAASTVGHELVHTVGMANQSECTAYTWEVDNAIGTGLDSSDNAANLQNATSSKNQYCQ